MEIFCYRQGADKVEEGFTRDELPALLADQTNVVWVDIQGESDAHLDEAREVMLNVFGFHAVTVEECFETRRQPKIEGFDDYIYFVVHGIKPGETNAANFVTKELDGFLGSNYLVTFHIQRFLSIKTVKQRIRNSTFVSKRGAAYLLHHILDELIDLYMPIVDDYDQAINDLEDRVIDMKRTNNDILGEVMDLRRSVARLKRISSRQLDVLYRMSHGEFPQIPENVLPFFRNVHDHLQRISDLAEGYRDLVAGLFDIHFAVVGNRTNDVMKTLAVLSAIILPLSLIAGIYGMNFENMPELKTELGYYMTLGLMALITVILLVYFWRRGWIFQRDQEITTAKTPSKKAD
ncbi:MAG: magnesium/cobalt transporter CorA [Pyrinomonadaceae bacterium]